MSKPHEVNPDHPVVKELSDNWHKVCGAVMTKLGVREVLLTPDDVVKFGNLFPGDDAAILAHAKKEGLLIKIISMKEAKRLGVQ